MARLVGKRWRSGFSKSRRHSTKNFAFVVFVVVFVGFLFVFISVLAAFPASEKPHRSADGSGTRLGGPLTDGAFTTGERPGRQGTGEKSRRRRRMKHSGDPAGLR